MSKSLKKVVLNLRALLVQTFAGTSDCLFVNFFRQGLVERDRAPLEVWVMFHGVDSYFGKMLR